MWLLSIDCIYHIGILYLLYKDVWCIIFYISRSVGRSVALATYSFLKTCEGNRSKCFDLFEIDDDPKSP